MEDALIVGAVVVAGAYIVWRQQKRRELVERYGARADANKCVAPPWVTSDLARARWAQQQGCID